MVLTPRMLQRIRRLGGKARMARLTAKERSELARKAAQARWQKTVSNFKHEVRPQERPYDYYEAHPEHRPRRQTRRTLRRRLIREV
jgi:hypothetical protein